MDVVPGRTLRSVVRLALVLLCAGCATLGEPVVAERSPVNNAQASHHVVRPGDTLYSISYRYRLDVDTLAGLNGLAPPYTIFPGQRLVVRRSAARTSTPSREAVTPKPPAKTGTVAWQWPLSGRVVNGYGRRNRGVDIDGGRGTRVRASAAGEVVYAGHGLSGYEQLVIIKHNAEYLSAYSLNGEMSVAEGQQVAEAEVVARLSRGPLHFEIRRRGEPVDPQALLPRRN